MSVNTSQTSCDVALMSIADESESARQIVNVKQDRDWNEQASRFLEAQQ